MYEWVDLLLSDRLRTNNGLSNRRIGGRVLTGSMYSIRDLDVISDSNSLPGRIRD